MQACQKHMCMCYPARRGGKPYVEAIHGGSARLIRCSQQPIVAHGVRHRDRPTGWGLSQQVVYHGKHAASKRM